MLPVDHQGWSPAAGSNFSLSFPCCTCASTCTTHTTVLKCCPCKLLVQSGKNVDGHSFSVSLTSQQEVEESIYLSFSIFSLSSGLSHLWKKRFLIYQRPLSGASDMLNLAGRSINESRSALSCKGSPPRHWKMEAIKSYIEPCADWWMA